jgi:ubiquinone/menaquinone biosynthesis C-methylase UbiE
MAMILSNRARGGSFMLKNQFSDGPVNRDQNQVRKSGNPFTDPRWVERYESWYQKTGRRADYLEKCLLGRLLESFPKAHSLVEIGCGTAHFTRWFESQGFRVVGLDISKQMLAEAMALESLPFLQGDALKIPLAGGAFDLSVMVTTLEFLPDPLAALTEALRVCRRGLILGVLNRQSLLWRQIKKEGSPLWNSAHLFTPNELVCLIRQAVGKDSVKIFWRTALWSLIPCSSRLPWGGFIGMAVSKNKN